MQVLTNANADVNAVGGENETAVFLSAKLRFWDIVKMLKENGAHRPSEEEEKALYEYYKMIASVRGRMS